MIQGLTGQVEVYELKSKTRKAHAVLKGQIQGLRGLLWTFEGPYEKRACIRLRIAVTPLKADKAN